MQRVYVHIAILLLILVLGLSSPAAAIPLLRDDDSILPRVMATVVALDRRGLATIQANDGTTSQVVSGTKWRVGDPVTCERSDKPNVPLWKAFDCRKS